MGDNSNHAATTEFVARYLPGATNNVAGTGYAGLDNPGEYFIYQHPSTFNPDPALRVQRDVPAGSVGTVNDVSPTIWALTSTASSEHQFEYGILAQMYNHSLSTGNVQTQSQNVALTGTVFKQFNSGDSGEIAPSFGGNILCSDQTGVVDPNNGCVGLEVDSFTTAAGTDAHRSRVALNLAVGSYSSSPTNFGYGALIGPAQSKDILDRAVGISNQVRFGLDTTAATIPDNGAALIISPNQKIVVDGGYDGGYFRSLRYQDGGLYYHTQNGDVHFVTDQGAAFFGVATDAGYRLVLTNSSGYCIHTPGASSETVSCSSDKQLKKDIVDAEPALPQLSNFRVRDFTVKSTGERRVGVVAQEVQKAHPDMVHAGSDGMLTVDEPSPWLLVRANQELEEENRALGSQIHLVEVVGALGLGLLGFFSLGRAPRSHGGFPA